MAPRVSLASVFHTNLQWTPAEIPEFKCHFIMKQKKKKQRPMILSKHEYFFLAMTGNQLGVKDKRYDKMLKLCVLYHLSRRLKELCIFKP